MAIPSTYVSSPNPLVIPDLKSTLPHPQTPWNLSSDLFQRVRNKAYNKSFRTCEILNTDPEFNFILKYFEYQKPPGFGIKRIVCIHNPAHTQSFEATVKNIEQEVSNSLFAPKWQEEAMKDERGTVIRRWKKQVSQFSPLEISSKSGRDDIFVDAKVLPLWHGSSREKCESICASGFTYFGKHDYSAGNKGESTDFGYFGSGIYFTNSAKYAAMYSPEGILLLSWVSMREPYPVINDVPHPQQGSDMRKLKGQKHYLNYNAHYIPVASIKPDDPKCMNYYPCYENQTPAWDEFVIFQTAQALPRFWIELTTDSPEPPLPESDPTLSLGLLKTIEGLKPIYAFKHLQNRNFASISTDNTIQIWDLLKERCISTLEGHSAKVLAISLLHHLVLASGSNDKTIKLWNISSGKCIRTLEGHSDAVTTLAILPQKIISGSKDKTIKLWSVGLGLFAASDSKLWRTFKGHSGPITSLAILNDETFASGSEDRTIKFWNINTGECLRTLEGHSSDVTCLAVFSNEVLISGSADRTIKKWKITTGECISTLKEHTSTVLSLIKWSDRLFLSGSQDNTIKLWDINKEKSLYTKEGHLGSVNGLASLPDGTVISGSEDKTLKIWNVLMPDHSEYLPPSNPPNFVINMEHLKTINISCRTFTILDKITLASGMMNDRITLWDMRTWKNLTGMLLEHTDSITAILRLDDWTYITGSLDKTIAIWYNGKFGRLVLKGHSGGVTSLAIAKQRFHLVSGSMDHTVRLWNITEGCELLYILKGHLDTVNAVTITEDEKNIISGSNDKTIKIWEPPNIISTLEGHSEGVTTLAPLPEKKLASGSHDKTIKIWSLITGSCLCTLSGHTDSITFLKYFDCGLVSGSRDNSIRIWDLNTGKLLKILEGHLGFIHTIDKMPNSNNLLSGSNDGTIKIWGTN